MAFMSPMHFFLNAIPITADRLLETFVHNVCPGDQPEAGKLRGLLGHWLDVAPAFNGRL